MEHGYGAKWDEPGCFVYQLLEDMEVRSFPTVADDVTTKGKVFFKGEFVSVDLIRHSRVPKSLNGPFLRLSDCSGWLFERRKGFAVTRRIAVEKGLWNFYADNVPDGVGLRCHPIDRRTSPNVFTDPKITFLPMQKLYCDRRVTSQSSGVHYYRVQGTKGWVFDRLGEDITMLMPESKIQTGLFAFRVLPKGKMAIRRAPTVDEESKTLLRVEHGDTVVVDVIRLSPFVDSGNGPFLRLADGSGWLFEFKHNERMLEEVYVESGKWRAGVVCSVGVALRLQPIDKYVRSGKVFATGEVVVCDRKIRTSNGVTFYRAEGMNGWCLDKRDDEAMMKLLSPPVDEKPALEPEETWSPDFVRGVATAIIGTFEEISYNPQLRVISFLNDEGVRINVNYETRVVGATTEHAVNGKSHLIRKDCSSFELAEIFRDPSNRSGKDFRSRETKTEPGVECAPEPKRLELNAEDETRRSLLKCDEEIERRLQNRVNLLKALQLHDQRRAQYEHSIYARRQSYDLLQKQQQERRKMRKEENERGRGVIVTCQECGREFLSPQARLKHFREDHDLYVFDDGDLDRGTAVISAPEP